MFQQYLQLFVGVAAVDPIGGVICQLPDTVVVHCLRVWSQASHQFDVATGPVEAVDDSVEHAAVTPALVVVEPRVSILEEKHPFVRQTFAEIGWSLEARE